MVGGRPGPGAPFRDLTLTPLAPPPPAVQGGADGLASHHTVPSCGQRTGFPGQGPQHAITPTFTLSLPDCRQWGTRGGGPSALPTGGLGPRHCPAGLTSPGECAAEAQSPGDSWPRPACPRCADGGPCRARPPLWPRDGSELQATGEEQAQAVSLPSPLCPMAGRQFPCERPYFWDQAGGTSPVTRTRGPPDTLSP